MGTAGAKAWHVGGAARRPVWLEQSYGGEVLGNEVREVFVVRGSGLCSEVLGSHCRVLNRGVLWSDLSLSRSLLDGEELKGRHGWRQGGQ